MGENLGNFHVVEVPDGDTIRVDREAMPVMTTRKTLRLLSLDTEETQSPKIFGPVTEFAHEVKQQAKEWFASRGNEVTLKTDGSRKTGFFGRPLVQVFHNDEHYQRHAIEQGWSPYFCKYGYSREYHQQFADAENQARQHKRGIWSSQMQERPEGEGRPYEMLVDWWKMRAERIAAARKAKEQGENISLLLNGEDYEEVLQKAQECQQAIVFGEIARPSRRANAAGRGLFILRVKLGVSFFVYVSHQASDRQGLIEALETYVSDTRDMPASMIKANYIALSGKLEMFRQFHTDIPEIVVYDHSQIVDLGGTLPLTNHYLRRLSRQSAKV